jgi:tetratricopeptide (TPR) repeat protein
MTREVAYESLLYADRRQLHRHIGASIEAQRAGRLSEYWEVLAYHFDLAGEWEKALDYHLKAANKAQEVYANEDAMYHFRQALEAAEQLSGSEQQQLEAHEGLGEVLTLVGRYDEALESYEQARAVLREMGVSPEINRRRADLYRRIAQVYEYQGEYATAQTWINKGVAALHNLPQTLEAVRLYLLRGGIYHRQGDNQEAIRWCKQAFQCANEAIDKDIDEEIAHAAYLMGEIYRRQGKSTQATQSAQRSLKIYRKLNNLIGQGQAHNTLANTYFEQSDWQAAMEHYHRSLTIKERVGDVYGQGVLDVNIGEIHRLRGELEEALQSYQQGLSVWDALGVTYGKGLIHNNLGAVYLRLGDLEQATAHLDQSEDLFAQIPSDDFVAETSRYRAEIALRQERLDEAMVFAERSLTYAQNQGLKADECAAHRVLGQIYREQDDLQRSKTCLLQSLDLARQMDNQYEIGRTTFQIGLLQEKRGQRKEARASLREAHAIFESLDARWDLAAVERDLNNLMDQEMN